MIDTKKYKHIEDVIEDYLQLKNELAEIPLVYDKLHEKVLKLNESRDSSGTFPVDEAQDYYKIFAQQHKVDEREEELKSEFSEVESILKAFLGFISGKVEYARKEDHEKTKVTYLFWLDDDQIRSNR